MNRLGLVLRFLNFRVAIATLIGAMGIVLSITAMGQDLSNGADNYSP